MIVSAPASSANLGPGFDCLGLALELPFELSDDESLVDGWLPAEPTHPATVAFVAAGGDPELPLRWRSPIPPGRGLGFSGAARVAGAYLALRSAGMGHELALEPARSVATDLEGHADNASASAMGGFTVAAGDAAVSLAVPEGVQVLVWWPDRATSTDASRRVLPDQVSLGDAAFSIARSSLWVAALASGDLDLLRTAMQDRLHQPSRLAARPDVAEVLAHLVEDDHVLAAWLSGSGPTVAALVRSGDRLDRDQLDRDRLDDLAASIPIEGRSRVVSLASTGVHVVSR